MTTRAFTEHEWDELLEMARLADKAERDAFTEQLHEGPNGDFWQHVDEQIKDILG